MQKRKNDDIEKKKIVVVLLLKKRLWMIEKIEKNESGQNVKNGNEKIEKNENEQNGKNVNEGKRKIVNENIVVDMTMRSVLLPNPNLIEKIRKRIERNKEER